MRKNIERTYDAWVNNKEYRSKDTGVISTNGVTIFSFKTPIVFISRKKKLTLNTRKYSQTTTRHQNALRSLMNRDEREFTEMDGHDMKLTFATRFV